MISTQPGSTPLSSFKIVSLEDEVPRPGAANDIGPYGDQDDEQVGTRGHSRVGSIVVSRSKVGSRLYSRE